MRYILVLDRRLKREKPCAFCLNPVEVPYVRETGTKIVYCSVACYEGHVFACNAALGGLDAPARLPLLRFDQVGAGKVLHLPAPVPLLSVPDNLA